METQQIQILTRPISKGYHGWAQKTHVTLTDGTVWKIHTGKTNRGGIYTAAQRVTLENGMESFMLYGDPTVMLVSEYGKCTEKGVATQHTKAIKVFVEKVAPNPPTDFEEGTKLGRKILSEN